MAARLLESGEHVVVWNRTRERCAPLRTRGADVAEDPADAVSRADLTLSVLANPAAVREVCSAVAAHVRPSAALVEMSTIGPAQAAAIADLVPGLVHVPVLGSVDRARRGHLRLLVGGGLAPHHRAVLGHLGELTVVDSAAHAAALKLVINAAVLTGICAISDALALAALWDLEDDLVSGLLAASPAAGLLTRARSTDAEFTVELATKDLELAMDMARMHLPMAEAAHASLASSGMASADITDWVAARALIARQ